MPKQRTIAACNEHAARQFTPWAAHSFTCGRCGQPFETKAAKMRHKRSCSPVAQQVPEAPCEDEHLYADMRRHTSPMIVALAKAEWDAMDWRGNLPDDWPERRAQLEKEWNNG